MAVSFLGKSQVAVNTASLADGDSIASYLVDAAGSLLTSTAIGGKQRLDVNGASEHLDGAAYAAGTDYLSSMAAVDESGNWQPLRLNASDELLVAASVSFTAEHAEDDAFTNGDTGVASLLVRQDTLASSTSADGDYGSFKSNALGELYTHDTSALAELVLIKGDTASIASSTSTTATNTGNTATSTASIDAALAALSKAEDAAHSSGDKGIQALAVRKDAQGTNAGSDGDYASFQTWSEGSLKVVDIANGSLLQQQVSVGTSAAAVPSSPLANRKSLMLQNTSTTKMWIGSSTVTASGAASGIELPANSFMELEVGPAVAVYAIKTGSSGNLNVLEMA